MSIRLDFEIILESDYHVGAGYGDGLVDSILLRDGDGTPAIRGSAISGLLRDAVWQLLQYGALVDSPKCQRSGLVDAPPFCLPADDPCPVCRLFGTPGQPKRWRISSARPAEKRAPMPPISGSSRTGQVVHRVRIDPLTRRAEARKLFSEEQGAAALKFVFAVKTQALDASAVEEAALLVAAARAVRGLGRARRRGRGACRIHLVDREAEKEWIERFEQRWLDGQPLTGKAERIEPEVPELASPGEPYRVRLFVRADEPLLVARRAEAGNEFESVGLIPGTAVLGALAGRVARRYDLKGDADAKDTFVQLFLRDRIRFSALLPAQADMRNEDLIPSIPAPLDMLTCKAFPGFRKQEITHSVQGFALADSPPDSCPDCAQKYNAEDVPLKPLGGFVTLAANPETFEPRRCHEMHIAVDPWTGRVQEQNLFGYVSLEAGQYFLGELTCASESDWQALRQMAKLPSNGDPLELRVGRAGKRGHGQISALFKPVADSDPADLCRGLPLAERVAGTGAGGKLVMTLLSDCILPDGWMRAREGFTKEWLKELLGVELKIHRAFARMRPVDGFWGHLGLPRFRDLALTAGSAVGISLVGEPPEDWLEKLAGIEQTGIGLRRQEGYGQVVFNHPLYHDFSSLSYQLALPDALRPNQAKLAPDVIESFETAWNQVLGKLGEGEWKNEIYDAVARLLRHGAGGKVSDLETILSDKRFGRTKNILGDDLGGPRAEKKVVRDTRHGRNLAIRLLEQLEDETLLKKHPDLAPQMLRLGIEMLADRVGQGVAAARAEKKELKNE